MTSLIPAWVDGTLSPIEKIDVHRRGLRHKAVSVFVMRGTDTLIQRRALSKYHTPGLWANSCCTHPKWGEDPFDCAIRRLDEELGIIGLDLVHCGQVEYRADVGDGMIEHELVDIFRTEATTAMNIAPNPEEVADACWNDLDDLVGKVTRQPDLFTPWLRIYLDTNLGLIPNPQPSEQTEIADQF